MPRARKRAAVLFRPTRVRILEQLASPATAAGVARRLDVPRQQVNYHLRALERAGLVELVEERKKGNCVERLVRATGRSYLVGAEALAQLAGDPSAARDRFSSAWLVAQAARAITEVADLRARAEAAGQRLATFTVDGEVRFTSAAARAAFFEELTNFTARLVARYHDPSAPGGRSFKLVTSAWPAIHKEQP
jgi:DNA-binding transcriptional ArsR family regulator